jgi:hypothetical protein
MNFPGIHPAPLRPVRSFPRNSLIRRRVYTPCCASCGEMPARLKKRLCASLPTAFSVDAVLVPAAKGTELASPFARSVAGLQNRCPWLRLLFLALEEDACPELPHAPANLRPVPGRDLPAPAPGNEPAYAAHKLPGLSEYYLREKFRSRNGMVFTCHAVQLWAYAVKRTVPCDMPYYYLNGRRADRKIYYAAMLREKDADSLPPFLCINDVGESPEENPRREDMRFFFLDADYPDPSSFERGGSPA